MYKSAIRAAPRRILPSRSLLNSSPARRFLSTAPPAEKKRGWTSSAVRWGLAIAGVYYYNTSSVFAEQPEAAIHQLDDSLHAVQESDQPTIDAIVEEKRRRREQQAAEEQQKEQLAKAALAEEEQGQEGEQEGGMDGLEDEASSQGAFNPETGEINWDCPCLGGMAHGPCGEEFKAAFSCFVYSNEEPKGVECIEKFKGMQDCFRQHPDMYGSELEDDEDEVEEELHARENAQASEEAKEAAPAERSIPAVQKELHRDSEHTEPGDAQKIGDEGGELVPKATHDATSSNKN